MKERHYVEVELSSHELKECFELLSYRVMDEKREHDAKPIVEAVIKLKGPNGNEVHTAELGNGPVNALDRALRKALNTFYPNGLEHVELVDFRVRAVNAESQKGTSAKVEVEILTTDGNYYWKTFGRGEDVIEASWQALAASFAYKLMQERAT